MTQQSFIITLLVVISLLGLTIYFIKFKSDEKAKIKSQGRKDTDVSADQYAEIIDDFPTYHRNK